MKYKKFKIYRTIVAATLGAIVGVFTVSGNYVVPIVAIIVAFFLMYFLKTRVKEVITDERIEKISGKASYMTCMIIAVGMAFGGIVLMAFKEKYPVYLPVAYTLSYLACGMILLYSIFFRYYYTRKI